MWFRAWSWKKKSCTDERTFIAQQNKKSEVLQTIQHPRKFFWNFSSINKKERAKKRKVLNVANHDFFMKTAKESNNLWRQISDTRDKSSVSEEEGRTCSEIRNGEEHIPTPVANKWNLSLSPLFNLIWRNGIYNAEGTGATPDNSTAECWLVDHWYNA